MTSEVLELTKMLSPVLTNFLPEKEYQRNLLETSTGDFFEEWNKITPQTLIRKFEEQTD